MMLDVAKAIEFLIVEDIHKQWREEFEEDMLRLEQLLALFRFQEMFGL